MAPTHQNWLALALLLTTVACERPTPAEPAVAIIDPGSTASAIDAALVMDCVTGASRDAGAAYCATEGQDPRCFPSPWDCTRESGGSIIDGTCKRTDH